MSANPRPEFSTARLDLVAPDPALAAAVLGYYRLNRAHLDPWGPPVPPGFYEEAWQRAQLEKGRDEWDAGRAWRWWLRERGHARRRVIGTVHFSQVVRGAFHNAMLGYSIDGACQGRGLMAEALRAAIAEVFSPAVNLHRIQANVRPENARSLRLLERLGFEREGCAREYLLIDGGWRDHVMTALRNPGFDLAAAQAAP
jgi:ribosomal-protein-alanine N-acetyltransferase